MTTTEPNRTSVMDPKERSGTRGALEYTERWSDYSFNKQVSRVSNHSPHTPAVDKAGQECSMI